MGLAAQFEHFFKILIFCLHTTLTLRIFHDFENSHFDSHLSERDFQPVPPVPSCSSRQALSEYVRHVMIAQPCLLGPQGGGVKNDFSNF